MDTTQILIKGLKDCGTDPDKVVYSLCVGDIVECITEIYGEEALEFTNEILQELIDIGIEGTENIDWWKPIEFSLKESKGICVKGDMYGANNSLQA